MLSYHPLESLRIELASPTSTYADPTLYPRLSVVETAGMLHVDFYGAPFDTPFERLCTILSDAAVAGSLATLTLRSPDEGGNGTCNWDLTPLVDKASAFPKLEHFSIQQNQPGDHNRIIVARSYDEEGVLGRLLSKAPVLDAVIVPSAPDESFFRVQNHPLRFLSVDAGYDTQSFIANLAKSASFPKLESLEFGEYAETYVDGFPEGCTPIEDYRQLFRSRVFARLRAFTWRNPVCSADEIAELRAIVPDLQFRVVRFSAEYLRRDTK
ncbi:MAG: hypothetical protein HOW73_22510 [Polyangiaceae bacterium]|nr:hypothetical protein [Polyangiaceae bacterium]